MSNGWLTAFPKQGQWFHLHTLMSAGIIIQWVDENYRKTRVKAITSCGDDMRKWRLTTAAKVRTFCVYMKYNSCTGNGKVRVSYKKRHHRKP